MASEDSPAAKAAPFPKFTTFMDELQEDEHGAGAGSRVKAKVASAGIVCCVCSEAKTKVEFAPKQLKKKKGLRLCRPCASQVSVWQESGTLIVLDIASGEIVKTITDPNIDPDFDDFKAEAIKCCTVEDTTVDRFIKEGAARVADALRVGSVASPNSLTAEYNDLVDQHCESELDMSISTLKNFVSRCAGDMRSYIGLVRQWYPGTDARRSVIEISSTLDQFDSILLDWDERSWEKKMKDFAAPMYGGRGSNYKAKPWSERKLTPKAAQLRRKLHTTMLERRLALLNKMKTALLSMMQGRGGEDGHPTWHPCKLLSKLTSLNVSMLVSFDTEDLEDELAHKEEQKSFERGKLLLESHRGRAALPGDSTPESAVLRKLMLNSSGTREFLQAVKGEINDVMLGLQLPDFGFGSSAEALLELKEDLHEFASSSDLCPWNAGPSDAPDRKLKIEPGPLRQFQKDELVAARAKGEANYLDIHFPDTRGPDGLKLAQAPAEPSPHVNTAHFKADSSSEDEAVVSKRANKQKKNRNKKKNRSKAAGSTASDAAATSGPGDD